MYTQDRLFAIKAVFEYHSAMNCKAYRLVNKACKIISNGESLDTKMIASLNLHTGKYKHFGLSEFCSRASV